MGEISFRGDPPYELPIAQGAEARAVDILIEVTLRISAPHKRPDPAPIRVRLPLEMAQSLRSQLQAVVPIAERKMRR
jgi:hypothetical protein